MDPETNVYLSGDMTLTLRNVQDATQLALERTDHCYDEVTFTIGKFELFRRQLYRMAVAVIDRYFGVEPKDERFVVDTSTTVTVKGYGENITVNIEDEDRNLFLTASEWFCFIGDIHRITKLFYERFTYPYPNL